MSENETTENALLWLANDEGLYNTMIAMVDRAIRDDRPITNTQARRLLADCFGTHTPDGYNLNRVQITLVTEYLNSERTERK